MMAFFAKMIKDLMFFLPQVAMELALIAAFAFFTALQHLNRKKAPSFVPPLLRPPLPQAPSPLPIPTSPARAASFDSECSLDSEFSFDSECSLKRKPFSNSLKRKLFC